MNALNAARKRGLKRHVLSWRFKAEIEEFYKEARRLTVETGILHTVDHIWPINGENFCGLHLPWNLRIVTQVENSRKRNLRPNESGSSVLNMEM
jgi:5-methylcytosine-specific restriction endonuclease McrA